MQRITLTRSAIEAVDIGSLLPYVSWNDHKRFFPSPPGQEHYRLLAYLSTQIKCKRIIDIGTYLGSSAVALSLDMTKEVLTYDIADWIPHLGDGKVTVKDRSNIRCSYDDYLDDLADLVQGCDLVMVDIDHTGRTEELVMQKLREIKYTGLVLLDDIRLNDEMKRFYAAIPERTVDVTEVGHWSGTGIVVFDDSRFQVVPLAP